MNNSDFYPTPDSIIYKMLNPYLKDISKRHGRNYTFKNISNVLEPSAGNGNIVDWISNNVNLDKKDKIYTIESDSDLQYVLRGKGYRLIDSDFINYSGDYKFDLIIMNPPFSNGDEHLLKAWDIIKNGDIVCLLNYETINNPYSKQRKLLKQIIDDYGEYEYLGNVFSNAERQTNVEVALVRLYKKQEKEDFQFDFEKNEQQYDLNEETVKDTLAFNDITGNMLRQYEKTKEAYVDYIKAREKLKFYSQGLIDDKRSVEGLASESYSGARDLNHAYNNFLDDFKFYAWKNILEKLNIEKYLTQKEFDRFQEFAKEQGSVDLTKENIAQLIQFLMYNRETIMENAIVEVFDIFTKYYKENRIHIEGWKTNDFYKVNKKIILPNYIRMGFTNHFDTNIHYIRQFEDIDKVMSYITGKNYNDIYKLSHAVRDYEIGSNNKLETEFFKIRCFKKGTIHLYFKNDWLWAEFNQRATKGKNWLGN